MNKKNTELIHKISIFLKGNYIRSDFSHKKIKQKNKRTYITQKKPYRIFIQNISKIKQFVGDLFFYYKIYYYFCTPF